MGAGASTPDESVSDDLLDWAWTIICNAGEGDWTRESADWQEAAAKFREEYHAHLDARPKRYWHAYQATIPDLLEEAVGPVVGFTVVADSPVAGEDAPKTHLGTVFAHELVFRYVMTWDHEPTEAEREQAQLAQFQLAKEKEEQ
jgi:hypothetical protein